MDPRRHSRTPREPTVPDRKDVTMTSADDLEDRELFTINYICRLDWRHREMVVVSFGGVR